jgi:hypothetical protein
MPANRRAWGQVLIWLGVLAWLPFFYLLSVGREVSIFPFLALHLTGVLGGSWLRNQTNKQQDAVQGAHGRRRKMLGKVLIYLGVLAWAPYFYLTRMLGQAVEIDPFLIAHLTGVLGGAALQASLGLENLLHRNQPD